MYIFKSLKLVISKQPGLLFVEIINTLLGMVIAIIPIRVVKYIVESYENALEFSSIISKVIIYFAICLLISVVLFLTSLYEQRISRLFNAKVSVVFYEKLSTIDYSFHDNPMFLNDFTRSLEEGVDNIYRLANCSLKVVEQGIKSLSVLLAIIAINFSIVYAIIVITILYMLVALRIGLLNNKRWKAERPFRRKVWYNNRMFTLKDGMADIKISDIDDMLIDNNNEANNNLIKQAKKYNSRTAAWGVVSQVLLVSIYPLSILLLSYVTKDSNALSLAGFSSLTVAATTMASLITSLISPVGTVLDVLPEVKVPFDLLKMEGKIEGANYGDTIEEFKNIKITHADFGYTEDRIILKDVNFEVNKGDRIAIVGANGAGKTTIVKLLLRLYDVTNGEISINGNSYLQTSPEKLRKIVGAVFQNVELYAVSIGENVLLRKPQSEEDYELIEKALKFSGLYETVMALPEGINTEISREFRRTGEILSGGQAQRLAIARGYAQNYQLIIFDEPSSALDPLAEAKVYNNMIEMGKDKTIIFISHRLTSTVHASKIYLFDEGKIIESGTHEELMKLGGTYHRMFVSQAAKYLGEDYE